MGSSELFTCLSIYVKAIWNGDSDIWHSLFDERFKSLTEEYRILFAATISRWEIQEIRGISLYTGRYMVYRFVHFFHSFYFFAFSLFYNLQDAIF